jgi:hypothetical protein
MVVVREDSLREQCMEKNEDADLYVELAAIMSTHRLTERRKVATGEWVSVYSSIQYKTDLMAGH